MRNRRGGGFKSCEKLVLQKMGRIDCVIWMLSRMIAYYSLRRNLDYIGGEAASGKKAEPDGEQPQTDA